jgi:hypothetical protein
MTLHAWADDISGRGWPRCVKPIMSLSGVDLGGYVPIFGIGGVRTRRD